MFDHIFIIHRAIDTSRDISELLKMKCTSCIEIIEPEPIKDNTDQLICMWSKKKQSQQNIISLYETNMKLLKRIENEKLNNVLILEDDAQLLHDSMELNQDCMLHSLYYTRWKERYIGAVANYYPSWKKTSILISSLESYRIAKINKHRPWDLELDYMRDKYNLNFSYNNYFTHPQNESTLGNNKFNL